MKLYITDEWCHKNNMASVKRYISDDYFELVTDPKKADTIWFPSGEYSIQPEMYPNTNFIFGPHFSTLPNEKIKKINNMHNNCVYIQPSEWVIKLWTDLQCNNIPLKVCPFGVDTVKFHPSPDIAKDIVLVYFKHRQQNELEQVCSSLLRRGIEFKAVIYNKYIEETYINAFYGVVTQQKKYYRNKQVIFIKIHKNSTDFNFHNKFILELVHCNA